MKKSMFLPMFLPMLLLQSLPSSGLVSAQELGEVAFRQALKDLGNDFRLLCVAAHPDDEDGATLAYYRMKYGVETHALIATRGEGGQNEIGPELYNELGVIRTREMMAASRIEGAKLHYLSLPEFGYSKSSAETFSVWGKEETLRRLVGKIREVRPQVIITHHPPTGGHGHHQVIGAALLEAFDLAADAEVFPEQGEDGLAPWQPLRLYHRAFEAHPDSVPAHIAELEPVRGKTYVEIAAEALREHRSQGMENFIDYFLAFETTEYVLVKEAAPVAFAEGQIAAGFSGPLFSGLPHARAPVRRALAASTAAPRTLLSRLGALLLSLQDAAGTAPSERAAESTARAMAIAAGIRFTVEVSDPVVIPGQAFVVTLRLQDFGVREGYQPSFSILAGTPSARWPVRMLQREGGGDTSRVAQEFRLEVPKAYPRTLPHAAHLFYADFLVPQIHAEVRLSPPSGNYTIPLSASTYVDVAPPVGLKFTAGPYLLRAGSAARPTIDLLLTNYAPGPQVATVHIVAPEGWEAAATEFQVTFSAEGEQVIESIALKPPRTLMAGDYRVYARVVQGGAVAVATLRAVDFKVPGKIRVGLVSSYDDTLRSTLALLDIPHQEITLGGYTADTLDGFSTVIVDIRAYQYNPDIVSNNQALLDYAARGGTLIVMYQKTIEWKPEYAPYPIQVSRNRVTVEDAPITLLAPEHPLFNTPNKIGPADWDGWLQERGLYFPDAWDAAYTPLIACSDPGEDIPPGSVLIARHGKGVYLYTALGWYRQLRERHAGALRVFLNMLAL